MAKYREGPTWPQFGSFVAHDEACWGILEHFVVRLSTTVAKASHIAKVHTVFQYLEVSEGPSLLRVGLCCAKLGVCWLMLAYVGTILVHLGAMLDYLEAMWSYAPFQLEPKLPKLGPR